MNDMIKIDFNRWGFYYFYCVDLYFSYYKFYKNRYYILFPELLKNTHENFICNNDNLVSPYNTNFIIAETYNLHNEDESYRTPRLNWTIKVHNVDELFNELNKMFRSEKIKNLKNKIQ